LDRDPAEVLMASRWRDRSHTEGCALDASAVGAGDLGSGRPL